MISKTFLISLLYLILNCDKSSSLKILGVFPLSTKSHFVMVGRVMKELAHRGHQVDVISTFQQGKPIPNYKDILIETQSSPVNNLSYEDPKLYNTLFMKDFVRDLGTDVCDLLSQPRLQQVLKTEKGTYDVIVNELFLAHCFLALGQHLNAPIVGIVSTKMYDWLFAPFGNDLNPSYLPSIFSSSSQRMTFWERLKNTLTITTVNIQVNHYLQDQFSKVEKYFGRKISSIQEFYNDVSLVLINQHHSLSNISPLTPDIIEVGGLHVFDEEQRLSLRQKTWLDESRDGCVYFTFGSMINIESLPEETLKVFYGMFERIRPVRVIMKIADREALPSGLPENVMVDDWLPQIAVLKHPNVKLFITHGGSMGIQEAIAHKVPILGIPISGDQYMNIKSCVEKKVAIYLDIRTITEESLTTAVEEILYNPSYAENMERLSTIFLDRPMSALDTAVYWIEYTARHGKVLKSPSVELNWWQFYLIDVYGVIFVGFVIIFYVVMKVISLVTILVRRSLTKSENMKKSEKSTMNVEKSKKKN